MDFRVLGSVGVVDGGSELSLGGARQRRLLAALVLDPGRQVPVERLVEVVWGDGLPPDGASKTVLSYLSRLRGVLGDGWVVTSDLGYGIDLRGTATVDALRFEELVHQARSAQPEHALRLLDEAIALWRGRAYGELADEDWCRPAASRLEELRLVALELRCQARLDLGGHAEVVPDLEALVAEHPLRERFRAQLMLALHRSGRQAEALRSYHEHRRYLAEETGLEPSRELVSLERRIAEDDPSVAFVTAGRTARGYVLADEIGQGAFGSVYRAVQPAVGREVAVKVVKAELADDPAYVRRFEGEARVVARLEHPHIVPLYDFWREPGAAYLVFRYLRGGSVEAARAGAGPWPLDRVDRLVSEIGPALAAAHAAEVVHRDVKPANLLYDEAGHAYLADFGIAVGALEVGPGSDGLRSAGSPLYASPEQVRDGVATARSDQYALGVVAWELLAGVAPFTGRRVTEILQTKLAHGLPWLADHRPDLPADVGAVLARAASLRPEDRYPSMLDFLAAWREAVARPARAASTTGELAALGPTRAGHAGEARATMASLGVEGANPYKGLRAFDEGDAAQFHGRASETEALVALVARHRLVAVVGPSGSGKSSLVRAAVVPRLRDDGGLVTVAVPGAQPVDELAEALLRIAVEAPPGLRERLADADALPVLLGELLPDDSSELVLVLDQFEELWTLCDPATRDALLAALLATATAPGSRLRLVVTIRADFYDRPLTHPLAGPLVRDATFALTPLGPAELEEAITAPASSVGVRVEPALVAALVADVTAQPAGLPLLQYTLTELYDDRAGSSLTKASYDSMGGLAGSIARRADEVHDELPPDQRPMARRLFARLITPGEGVEDTRRRARRSELTGVPAAVVDAFGAARLLAFDVDPVDREPTVEVAHEALIRHWPRLRAWLDEDRDGLRVQRHLADAATAWEARGRDAGDLLRGARLGAALEWADRHPDELSPSESALVEESSRRERRAHRARRAAVGGLAVLTVAAVVGAGLAVAQGDRADRNAAAAEVNAAAARVNADEAAASAAEADRKAAEAAASEQDAIAARNETALRKLAADAAAIAPSQPQLGMLLAVEAYRRNPGVESESALGAALTAEPGIRKFVDVGVDDAGLTAELDVGGGLVAVLVERHDGTAQVVVVDAATLAPTGVRIELERAGQVRVRPDGGELVTSFGDAFQRWDATTGEPVGPSVAMVASPAWQVEYLPTGSLVLAPVRPDGKGYELLIYPPGATEPSQRAPLPGLAVAMAVNPSGTTIAVSNIGLVPGTNSVLAFDARTLEQRTILGPHPHTVGQVGFTDDDRLLAADWPAGEAARLIELHLGGAPTRSVPLGIPAAFLVARRDGSALVSGYLGGFLEVSADLTVGPLAGSGLYGFDELPDGRLVRANRGGLVVLDPDERSIVATELESRGEPLVGRVASNADGTVLLVAEADGYQRYDGTTLEPIGEPVVPPFPTVAGIGSLSPDGRLVGFTGADRSVVVDADTGAPLWPAIELGGGGPPVFSPDGTAIAIDGVNAGGVILVADVATGTTRWSRVTYEGGSFGLHWSGDGARLGVGSQPRRPYVYDAADGTFQQDSGLGTNLAFAPQGDRAAVFSLDGDLRLVELDGGSSRVLGGGANLGDGWFTADGGQIVGLGQRSTLRVIDVATGDQVGNELPLTQPAENPLLVLGGSRVFDGAPGQRVIAYELDPDRRVELACEAVGRNLSADEWERFLGALGEYRATCPQYPEAEA